MRLKYNYHTHTKRCGHAHGEDEEYVKESISSGFKKMGFSDHIILPNIIQYGMRAEYQYLDDYLNSIKALKNKYQNTIEILTGFEAEYDPHFIAYYQSLLDEHKVDYLIMGQHCYFEDGDFIWYCDSLNNALVANMYAEHIIKGMATGLFSYVAHPDLYVTAFTYKDPVIEKVARKIAEASLKYDVPLEINMGHLRGNIHRLRERFYYPYDPFWKIVGEVGCKVVVGVDAHSPLDFETSDYQYVYDLIDCYHLNFVENYLPIKKPA